MCILAASLVSIDRSRNVYNTNLLGLFTNSDKELSPGSFEVIDVPIGFHRQILKDPPLLEMAKESGGDDTLVDFIQYQELVDDLM